MMETPLARVGLMMTGKPKVSLAPAEMLRQRMANSLQGTDHRPITIGAVVKGAEAVGHEEVVVAIAASSVATTVAAEEEVLAEGGEEGGEEGEEEGEEEEEDPEGGLLRAYPRARVLRHMLVEVVDNGNRHRLLRLSPTPRSRRLRCLESTCFPTA